MEKEGHANPELNPHVRTVPPPPQMQRFATPIQIATGFSTREEARLGHKVTFSSIWGKGMLLVQLQGHCFALELVCVRQSSDLLGSRVTVTVLVTATEHLEKLWRQ